MKAKTFFSLVVVLSISFTIAAPGQNGRFSGRWKLNTEKTTLADNRLFLASLTVTVKNDSLLTTRVYENGNGEEYPFNEDLSLDGRESKIFIYDMPRLTKAYRSQGDDTIIIESITTFTGNDGEQDLTTRETWTVDVEGKVLIIQYTNKMPAGESSGISYYNRIN